MARRRVSAIVIRDDSLLVIRRVKNSEEYFTFPGGGVEDGEHWEEALVREMLEETSLTVAMENLQYTLFDRDENENRLYRCSWLSGEPMIHAESPEMEKIEAGQVFEPVWMPRSELGSLVLYPLLARDWIAERADDYERACTLLEKRAY